MSDKKLIWIGRKEIAQLKSFGLSDVIVKIDSGAYTSSIDVAESYLIGNTLKVRFLKDGDLHTFTSFKTKNIKSSNGLVDERYIIKGEIELGGVIYKTEFSLSNRKGMRSPILLGRKLLNNNFVIDTSKSFTFGKVKPSVKKHNV